MSNFNDPLDELIRKHEIASKGENVENTNETQTPPVPDQIILPTTEPESIDIDYGDDTRLCDNQINMGHAQSLLTCGTNATINDASYAELNEDNRLPFTNAPYNNQSHIYANYYYTDINTCVVISPEHGREDKSICYCRSGDEYIYKQGAQLTRKEWDTDNKNRRIIWDG